jgi:hypothetical protein
MTPQKVGSKGVQASTMGWFHMSTTRNGSIDLVSSRASPEIFFTKALRTPVRTS